MITTKREYSIDFLKFFAALLITNSHIAVYEPLYRLSTGGSIGDALFFFCSGFTLFMGKMGRFDNWYKRRLSRIFPPVVCWAILAAFIFGKNNTITDILINGGEWFVQCILLYYLLAYPIRKYASRYLKVIWILVAIIVCAWFAMTSSGDGFMLYGWNYCKWAAFFLFFLQGAYIGQHHDSVKAKLSFGKSLVCLAGCTIGWYGLLYAQQKYHLSVYIQLLSLAPLLGISYYFFMWCKSDRMERWFKSRVANPVFRGIGGLCFEIYLVQNTIYHFVHIPADYPYNIPVLWLLIFFWAYILHIFNNFMLQTVREPDYDWKKMFTIY